MVSSSEYFAVTPSSNRCCPSSGARPVEQVVLSPGSSRVVAQVRPWPPTDSSGRSPLLVTVTSTATSPPVATSGPGGRPAGSPSTKGADNSTEAGFTGAGLTSSSGSSRKMVASAAAIDAVAASASRRRVLVRDFLTSALTDGACTRRATSCCSRPKAAFRVSGEISRSDTGHLQRQSADDLPQHGFEPAGSGPAAGLWARRTGPADQTWTGPFTVAEIGVRQQWRESSAAARPPGLDRPDRHALLGGDRGHRHVGHVMHHQRPTLRGRYLLQRAYECDRLRTRPRALVRSAHPPQPASRRPGPPPPAERQIASNAGDPRGRILIAPDPGPSLPGPQERFLGELLRISEVRGDGVGVRDDPAVRRVVQLGELLADPPFVHRYPRRFETALYTGHAERPPRVAWTSRTRRTPRPWHGARRGLTRQRGAAGGAPARSGHAVSRETACPARTRGTSSARRPCRTGRR